MTLTTLSDVSICLRVDQILFLAGINEKEECIRKDRKTSAIKLIISALANMNKIRATLSHKIQSAGRLHEITFKFSILETDELRVLTVLRIMEMFETIPQAKCKMKDTKDSIDLRNKANRMFVSRKELIKTWELYSQSIATALSSTQELSLAYANRSAILIKLHKYDECMQDIERALRLNYPDHLRGKLLCRKIECLKILNKMDLLNDTLGELKVWLERTTLASNDKQTFEQKLINSNNENYTQLKFTKSGNSPITIVPNKQIPCASEALTVKSNDEFGRHVVATRDIKPGEILVVEKPYSKILSLDELHTHCSNCLQVHWAMIPCEFCIYAMYCSEECKKEAWMKYHDIECPVTGYLVDLGFGKQELFSMRLAIVALRDAGCVEDLRESLKGKNGFSDGELYLSDSYVNLYNLVRSSEKRNVTDLFDRSLNAAFILYYLCTLTNLFGEKFNADIKDIYMNDDATFVGGLILRHMQIIPCNIHSYEEERQIEIVDIGAVALPFCSLINHSCDPNVSRCMTPNRMIVFALVPIKQGSQIYDNYGSHYAVMSKSERKSKLEQYYFDCNCEPCKHDWPVYKCLPSYTELVKDKEKIEKIEQIIEKLDTYVQYAKDDQIDDKVYMMSDLAKMIDTLKRLLTLPCVEVNNAVETLKRVVTLTYGNKFEIPKL